MPGELNNKFSLETGEDMLLSQRDRYKENKQHERAMKTPIKHKGVISEEHQQRIRKAGY